MYKQVAVAEQFGSKKVGVKIYVEMDRELTKEESNEIDSFCLMMIEKISLNTHLSKKSTIEDHENEVKMLTGLFPQPIYVKQIPSEYMPYSSPWLLVTTTKGIIKIGWRNRIINIDWSQSDNKKSAEEMFSNQETTMSDQTIHAWGYGKAREYIDIILK